jgi:hypothetical protein
MAVDETDIRRLALSLASAVEADHHGAPSFRVGGRIFCTIGLVAGKMMVKLDPEDQHNLCAGYSEAVAPVPGGWGLRGSTHVDLARIDEPLALMLLGLAHSTASRLRSRRRQG